VVEGANDIHRVLVGEYALGLREEPLWNSEAGEQP
jgi:hypothetical protein